MQYRLVVCYKDGTSNSQECDYIMRTIEDIESTFTKHISCFNGRPCDHTRYHEPVAEFIIGDDVRSWSIIPLKTEKLKAIEEL